MKHSAFALFLPLLVSLVACSGDELTPIEASAGSGGQSAGAAGSAGAGGAGAGGAGVSGASGQAGAGAAGVGGAGGVGAGAAGSAGAGAGGVAGAGAGGAGNAGEAGAAGAGGMAAKGDCCTTTPGVGGCLEETIQSCVCAQDDFCCTTEWDAQCVDEVVDFKCSALCGGAAGNGGAGGGMNDDPAVYVSVDGDNQNSGLSPSEPLVDLAAAIAVADSNGLSRIKICRGNYALNATLDIPEGMVLEGGYDCVAFTDVAPIGKVSACANLTDFTDKTVIDGSALGLEPALLIKGAGSPVKLKNLDVVSNQVAVKVDKSSPQIEKCRFQIVPDSTAVETAALRIQGGGALVKDSCLAGGGGVALSLEESELKVGSMGVLITEQSTATLTGNVILGGQGKGDAIGFGSVGVYLLNSSAQIKEGNKINGGNGSVTTSPKIASVGVYSVVTSPNTTEPLIQRNTIDGGKGSRTDSAQPGSVGVFLYSLDLADSNLPQVLDNSISGGRGGNVLGGAAASIGVAIDRASAKVEGNIIVGGEHDGGDYQAAIGVNMLSSHGSVSRNSIIGARGSYLYSLGVFAGSVSNVSVENNMIHGGSQKNATAQTSVAFQLGAADELRLRHNTLVLGPDAASSYGVEFQGPKGATPSIDVANNLLIGRNEPNHRGFRFGVCPGDILARFAGNSVLAPRDRAISSTPALNNFSDCLGEVNDIDTSAFGDFIPLLEKNCEGKPCKGHLEGNNSRFGDCSGSLCEPLDGCSSQDTCANVLFQAWSKEDAGAATLLESVLPGWVLKTKKDGLSCDVHQSPEPVDITTDRFGVTSRTPPLSRGAHEQNACD